MAEWSITIRGFDQSKPFAQSKIDGLFLSEPVERERMRRSLVSTVRRELAGKTGHPTRLWLRTNPYGALIVIGQLR